MECYQPIRQLNRYFTTGTYVDLDMRLFFENGSYSKWLWTRVLWVSLKTITNAINNIRYIKTTLSGDILHEVVF